jgi:hypothetical protein
MYDFRQWAATAACTLLLAACGGGGEDSAAADDGQWLTFMPSPVVASVQGGQSILITARSSKTLTETVNVAIEDEAALFDPTATTVLARDALTYEASLRIAANASAGRHEGSLTIRLCRDNPAICAQPFAGSPWRVPYRIDVSAPTAMRKLLFSETGVAFTATPRASRLEHVVTVRDNQSGITGWRASADQPWLQVTSSGQTDAQGNAQLTLQADPSALQADSLNMAQVTLIPDDPATVAPERLVVGLWKGSGNLEQVQQLTNQAAIDMAAVTDPAKPYVYVATPQGVDVFHTHLATRQGTLVQFASMPSQMAISDDGSRLYVALTSGSLETVDTATGSIVRSLRNPVSSSGQMTYIRPNGVGMLVLGGRTVLRADTGEVLQSTLPTNGNLPTSASASRDGSRLILAGAQGEVPQIWRTVYSESDPSRLQVQLIGGGAGATPPAYAATWRTWDLAVSTNGQWLAAVADPQNTGTESRCMLWDLRSGMALLGNLSENIARFVTVGADGRVHCEIQATAGMQDLRLSSYATDGSLLASQALNYTPTPTNLLGPLHSSGDGLVQVKVGWGMVLFAPTLP